MRDFVQDEGGFELSSELEAGVSAVGADGLRSQCEANAVRRHQLGGAQDAEEAALARTTVGWDDHGIKRTPCGARWLADP